MGVAQTFSLRNSELFSDSRCELKVHATKKPALEGAGFKGKVKQGGRAYFKAAGGVVTCLVSVLIVPSGLLVVSFLVFSLPPPNTEKCT
jgi:hypothetical protein